MKSPHFYGHKLIDGVWQFVRRWTATSPIEVIPEEELRREHEERLAHLEAIKAAILKRNPHATPRDISVAIADDQKHHAAADPSTPEPVAHPIDPRSTGVRIDDGFVPMTCARCGEGFETQQPTVRKVCARCSGLVSVPTPDPKPAPAPPDAHFAPIPKPVGRPSEAGPDSNLSRGDGLSHLVPRATRAAAGTSRPELTKRTVPGIPAAGNAGPAPQEESPLLKDPAYQKARDAGDVEAMARIAAEFGRGKR